MEPGFSPDDVVAWLARQAGGEGVRSCFQRIRDAQLDGRAILSAEPRETAERVGAEPEVAPALVALLEKGRTAFIMATIGEPRPRLGGVGVAGRGRPETADWLTVREGYLVKRKRVKGGLHKSTKLRFFVLKQEPETRVGVLEYYEGIELRGILPLSGATLVPGKPGRFAIRMAMQKREVFLGCEPGQLDAGLAWVAALQQCIEASPQPGRQGRPPRPPRPRRDTSPAPVVGSPSYRLRVAEAAEEIDGAAVDDARWAALRKGWERANGGGDGGEGHLSEDEDEEDWMADMARQEEEEARRQEEERAEWLAQRQ